MTIPFPGVVGGLMPNPITAAIKALDLKKFICQKAAIFGRSLSDVTHSNVDAFSEAGVVVRKHVGLAGDLVSEVLTDATRGCFS